MNKNLKDHNNKVDISKRRRTLTRIMAIQVFYQFEFFEKQESLENLKNNLIENYALYENDEILSYRDKIDGDFLDNLINGLSLYYQQLDTDITALLRGETKIEKLSNILLQILRFAAFELKFARDISFKIIINEYVDIAASFFDAGKITFVNSILENLARKYRQDEFN